MNFFNLNRKFNQTNRKPKASVNFFETELAELRRKQEIFLQQDLAEFLQTKIFGKIRLIIYVLCDLVSIIDINIDNKIN